jgi:hypothetical protein
MHIPGVINAADAQTNKPPVDSTHVPVGKSLPQNGRYLPRIAEPSTMIMELRASLIGLVTHPKEYKLWSHVKGVCETTAALPIMEERTRFPMSGLVVATIHSI